MTTPPAANLGLCATCRWACSIESARGARFLRCSRSDLEPAYPRYPRLPVQACAGFQIAPPSAPPRHSDGEGAGG